MQGTPKKPAGAIGKCGFFVALWLTLFIKKLLGEPLL